MLLTVGLGFLLFTCVDSKELDQSNESMSKTIKGATHRRDSAYLEHTVRQFINSDYEDFHYVYRYGKDKERVNIYISNIFYGPDTLKFLSFVILEIPVSVKVNKRSLEDPNKKYYYNGHPIVGIRDSVNDSWDVYCLSIYRPMNYSKYEKVRSMLTNFFFEEFKFKKGHGFTCNLDEPCFWTDENSLWRKGDIVPGYYNFQHTTNKYYYEREKDENDLSHFLVPKLDIEYPDSILNRFK